MKDNNWIYERKCCSQDVVAWLLTISKVITTFSVEMQIIPYVKRDRWVHYFPSSRYSCLFSFKNNDYARQGGLFSYRKRQLTKLEALVCHLLITGSAFVSCNVSSEDVPRTSCHPLTRYSRVTKKSICFTRK